MVPKTIAFADFATRTKGIGVPGGSRTRNAFRHRPLKPTRLPVSPREHIGAPGGSRTHGPRIKSPLLYHLSYGRISHLNSQVLRFGASSGIRTHGESPLDGFQDRCLQPLGHRSTYKKRAPTHFTLCGCCMDAPCFAGTFQGGSELPHRHIACQRFALAINSTTNSHVAPQ